MDSIPASSGKGTRQNSGSSSFSGQDGNLLTARSNRHAFVRTPSYEPQGPAFDQTYDSATPDAHGSAVTVPLGEGSSSYESSRGSERARLGPGGNRWWPEAPSGPSSRPSFQKGGQHSDELDRLPKDGVHASGYVNGGAGGYSSSAEGDLNLHSVSQMGSGSVTPIAGLDHGDATESEISEYDEQRKLRHPRGSETPRGSGSVLRSIGKSLKGEGFWGSSASGYAALSGPRARSSKKSKWSKTRTADRGPLLNSSLSSASKGRRRTSSPLLHPLRMIASFLSKLFRTFFGPIHPITIVVALVLIASFVASVTKLIIYILNPDKEPLPWRTYCQQQPPFPHAYADALAPVDVFVGVFSIDSAFERRHLIRSTYAAHTLPLDPQSGLPTSNIQVKFIIGRPRKAHARRVALEMETFNDIVVLDMEENMNRGKTHAYFQWAAENATVPFLRPIPSEGDSQTALPAHFSNGFGQTKEVLGGSGDGRDRFEVAWKKADYVVKADDDAFIVLEELERHLRVAPRQMTYWGYLIRNWFMGGECYALSHDLVRYVATSETVLHYTKGKEDKKVAQWINLHPNRSSIHWVSEHCWIYDHPKAGTAYSHGFLFPDYVEKIKLEGRRGLSDQEIARRGGEHRAKSFSTVSRWHQAYTEPRNDLTVEEEVEALIEGGGRWAGTWVRGEEGNDTQVWVPWEQIVYDAADERLKSPLVPNLATHASLADEAQIDPATGLTIRTGGRTQLGRRAEEDAQQAAGRRSLSAALIEPQPRNNLKARGGKEGKFFGVFNALPDLSGRHTTDYADRRRSQLAAMQSLHHRMVPLPTHKDSNGEEEALRAKRYLGRRHGGTVVVHFLKKSEWFYETALAFSGRGKMWSDGAGGAGSEWRMYGSPLVRHEDGYISTGRSQPRPDLELAYLQHARAQAQANAAQAQSQAGRVGSFTKPRSPQRQPPQQQPPAPAPAPAPAQAQGAPQP